MNFFIGGIVFCVMFICSALTAVKKSEVNNVGSIPANTTENLVRIMRFLSSVTISYKSHFISNRTTRCAVSPDWMDTFPPRLKSVLRNYGLTPAFETSGFFQDLDVQESNPVKFKLNIKKQASDAVVCGIDDIRPIDVKNCMSEEIRKNPSLSSPVECARTCRQGEKPKTCYYHFMLERYPVNGIACRLCTPNVTNHLCPNCQCVPGDGIERMALTVNRMIPGPSIEVCENDFIVVDVENRIKGESLSIHWHGIFQKGYQYYDGVPFVTQCPILDHTTFRYQFLADHAGTHFWHAHTGLHKMDGIFGNLIIRKPVIEEPDGHAYDFDLSKHVLLINDWMHEEATERYPGRNSGRVGQLPESVLINGKGRFTDKNGNMTNTTLEIITVEPNKRYRFRLINAFCTVCPGQITIQSHNLTLIGTDGQPIVPVTVDSIISFAGERYDFVLNSNQPPGAYWIQVRGMGNCQFRSVQQVAILQYNGASTTPSIEEPTYNKGLSAGYVLNPLDGICNTPRNDGICISDLRSAVPIDEGILQEKADVKLFLPIRTHDMEAENVFRPGFYQPFFIPMPNGPSLTLLDGISFKFPPSPPSSQIWDLPQDQFCNSRNLPRNCTKNCICTHMIEVPSHSIVEIILIDEFQAPSVAHPFHLHGHAFHVLSMGQPFEPIRMPYSKMNKTTTYNRIANVPRQRMNMAYAIKLDKKKEIKRCFDSPAGKDTVPVPNNGYTVLRFRANNPGYWLFHCHFIYHQMVGMDLILHVGEQAELPPVPWNFPKCGNYKPSIHRNIIFH